MHRIGRWALVLWFVSALPLVAQVLPPPSPPPPPASQGPPPPPVPGIRLYVDCTVSGCDFDYLRTEIPFVDHVRNRQDADVVVLATGRTTGSGGTEVTLKFIGQGPFKGLDDEMVFVMGQNDSEDVRRRDLVQMLKLGLARYAGRVELGRRLQISERRAGPAPPPGAPRAGTDPWDYWVFRISMNGDLSGESLSKSLSMYGSVNANRTTEAWKLNFSGSANYNQDQYTFSDGSDFTSIRRNYSSSALVVKSLTGHWSAGARGSVGTSSYYNQHLAVKAAPVIEYDIFPYSESTRRMFTLQYAVGYNYFKYEEVTLYGKMAESLPSQEFIASISVKQPWGSVSGSSEFRQYLSDLSKYNLEIGGYASLKLLKGLALNVGGSTSWVRDQVFLPRGAATDEEVLVRQRQRATSYSYGIFFGISYSFGSIYNNVVNPRMGGGGGGVMMFF